MEWAGAGVQGGGERARDGIGEPAETLDQDEQGADEEKAEQHVKSSCRFVHFVPGRGAAARREWWESSRWWSSAATRPDRRRCPARPSPLPWMRRLLDGSARTDPIGPPTAAGWRAGACEHGWRSEAADTWWRGVVHRWWVCSSCHGQCWLCWPVYLHRGGPRISLPSCRPASRRRKRLRRDQRVPRRRSAAAALAGLWLLSPIDLHTRVHSSHRPARRRDRRRLRPPLRRPAGSTRGAPSRRGLPSRTPRRLIPTGRCMAVGERVPLASWVTRHVTGAGDGREWPRRACFPAVARQALARINAVACRLRVWRAVNPRRPRRSRAGNVCGCD